MTPPAARKKLLLFYSVTVLLSLLAALAVVEVVLRQLAWTNGTAMGFGAQQRWYDKHWKPVNELQFRDLPLAGRVALDEPRLYFLGDSFTAGNGVDFEQTYYFRAAWQPRLGYNPFNLSRPGASTLDELSELQRFNAQTGASARVVVQQYFPNDIQDYIVQPKWTPPAWLTFAARHLESAQFLLAWRFSREWGQQYGAALKAAYLTPDLLARHLQDLRRLHRAIRAQGGTVVFLVFPALDSDASLRESGRLVQVLRRDFAASCQPGDALVDATVSAAALPVRERVLNFMDAHPSVALHARVADQLRQALLRAPVAAGPAAPYEPCEALRADLPAARGAPRPGA